MSGDFLKRPIAQTHGIIATVLAAAIFALLGYGIYSYRLAEAELKESGDANTSLRAAIVVLESKIDDLEVNVGKLQNDLSETQKENSSLASNLSAEVNKNNFFDSQIKEISGTVGSLTKLSKLDQELLQKYSKVYFLNENYVPEQFATIDSRYLNDKNELLQVHGKMYVYLQRLLDASINESAALQILSAYRSFREQSSLKAAYKFTYGSGANAFSADQGYSEHQLGTTVDFTTAAVGQTFSKFEASSAYAWLLANAYKYGFILSYPKGNSYYIFEPWHWRFVGVELATKLHDEGKYFYDLDQREIDTYLIKIFD